MGKKYTRVKAHIRVHCSCRNDDGDMDDDINENENEKTTEIKIQKVREGNIRVGW